MDKTEDVLELIRKSNRPLSISDIGKELGISYNAAKGRLHKLRKTQTINIARRGYYYFGKEIEPVIPPKGKMVLVGGILYHNLGSPRLGIYNISLSRLSKDFDVIFMRENDAFVFRKAMKYFGVGIHTNKRNSACTAIVESNILTEEERELLRLRKTKRVEIGFYPEEWGIEHRDIFSTESKSDGDLGAELVKYGDVRKGDKYDAIKHDLSFIYNGKKALIEVTEAYPQFTRGGSIKSNEIQARLYFALKCKAIRNIPMFIVIHEDWKKKHWLMREVNFLNNNNVHFIFASFKQDWEKGAAAEIMRLMG